MIQRKHEPLNLHSNHNHYTHEKLLFLFQKTVSLIVVTVHPNSKIQFLAIPGATQKEIITAIIMSLCRWCHHTYSHMCSRLPPAHAEKQCYRGTLWNDNYSFGFCVLSPNWTTECHLTSPPWSSNLSSCAFSFVRWKRRNSNAPDSNPTVMRSSETFFSA